MPSQTATGSIALRAGSLSLIYSNGSIRYIRLGPAEIIRQIYFALRGPSWQTVPAQIISETVHNSERDFHIELVVRHASGDIDFEWRGTISGGPENSIRFSVEGSANADFYRNRIGLCVLHPIKECAGQPCRIEHEGGRIEESRFPTLVSPHQPFFDIYAMSHEPLPNVVAEVRFSGEIFETEDQRNWSDASFKTYSTPLAIPYPVPVKKGDRLSQGCTLVVHGAAPAFASTPRGFEEITVNRNAPKPLGAIGATATTNRKDRRLAHVRIDIDCSQPNSEKLIAEAFGGETPVELALFTDKPASDLPRLADEINRHRARIARLLLFPRDGRLTQKEACRIARDSFNGFVLGGGSSTHFVEVNRNRQITELLDVVTWAVNPRAHSIEDLTMIENLGGQSAAVETARTFASGRPLSVSPVLVPQFPASAGWLVASLKRLLQTGVDHLTYRTEDSLLDEICNYQADSVLPSESSDPLKTDALVLTRNGASVAWMANFLPVPQTVRIEDQEIRLNAYALARLDLG
jgi:D-apionolactonase